MSLVPNLDLMTDDEKLAALESIHASINQSKEIQKKKIAENVQLVLQALKRIESDMLDRVNGTVQTIENRVKSIKDGKDGINGRDGKDGKDGRPGKDGKDGRNGRDGLPGLPGADGQDGVGVADAHIDFDGSLIITLTNGNQINVGEVVAPDLAESIKVISNGGGTSQQVLDTLASLQTQINNLIPSQTGNSGKFLTTNGSTLSWAQVAGGLNYQGTWNASTNTPTLTSGTGSSGYYYIVGTAGSTNLDGITDWQIGDWLVFNGTTWQKLDQTNLVTSVAGRTGAITLSNTDISGLGTMSTQAANNVAITGGSIAGASVSATTLTTSSTVTLNGGTANGVAYLNGSKVLTTGSTLTFDGANLGIDATVNVDSASTKYQNFKVSGTTYLQLGGNSNGSVIDTVTAGVPHRFYVGGSEQMRLTSTGLGIGTSSPAGKVDSVSNAYAAYVARSSTSGVGQTVDALKATDSAAANFANARYSATAHIWNYSGSTEGMRLDSSGNLGIGTSSPATKLHVVSTTLPQLRVEYNSSYYTTISNNGTFNVVDASTGNWYTFQRNGTPQMVIDNSGNVGIGTSSPAKKLDVNGDALIYGITVGRGAGAVSTNTAVGASALAANTTGGNSIAVGPSALAAQTTGDSNIAIGRLTLSSLTTGTSNTGVGYYNLVSNTGNDNTAVGSAAMNVNTTGSQNSALGTNAMNANTTGGSNTAIGFRSLFSNTTASNNTAVGYQAGYGNTTGTQNAYFGSGAGQGITTGSNNTLVGYRPAYGATNTGNYNVAVGNYDLYYNTSGSYNAVLGYDAMESNTTGSYNTAIGTTALFSNTTASNNTAVGYGAAYTNTTTTALTAVGREAAYNLSNGDTDTVASTFVGYRSGYSSTTAKDSTFIGGAAGFANTTGSSNTAVGAAALRYNTTASNNTAVGYQAGYLNTTGTDNTFFGRSAGESLTTGVSNTFIGRSSGEAITTGSKNSILGRYTGNQGGLDIRTSSNYIVLSDGDGNPRGIFDSSGNLQIGCTATGAYTTRMTISYDSGTTKWSVGPAAAATTRFYVASSTTTGVYIGSADTSWSSNSDERAKDIIEPISNAVTKVDSLRAVIGKYKTDEEGTRRSFLIAQDVQKVLPEAVDATDESNLAIRYTEVIPLLVASIKELKSELDSVKAELATLKGN